MKPAAGSRRYKVGLSGQRSWIVVLSLLLGPLAAQEPQFDMLETGRSTQIDHLQDGTICQVRIGLDFAVVLVGDILTGDQCPDRLGQALAPFAARVTGFAIHCLEDQVADLSGL